MRILLDENLDWRLRRDLPGHETESVPLIGWAGIQNGELLRKAVEEGFEVLVTMGYASVRGENMRSGFLQQCDDLFALHARKTFKKLLDRISCFQMIEEALRRHPRARKHWLASKHLGILRNDAAHAANVKIKLNRKPAGCIRPFPSSFIR